MEVGAGLILPTISLRGDDNDLIVLETGAQTGLDYLFDRQSLTSRLKSACPQMPVYDDVESVKKLGIVRTTPVVMPHWIPSVEGKQPTFKEWISSNRAPVGELTVVPYDTVMAQQ